jgi:hypothetical protein
LISQVAYPALDLTSAEQHAREALAIIEQQGLRSLPRPYLALAYALEFQGRFRECLQAFRRAADVARDQGRNLDLMEALANTVMVGTFAGDRAAPRDLEELAVLRSFTHNPRGIVLAAAATGVAALIEGRVEAASDLNEAADLAVDRLDVTEGIFRGWARIADAGGSPSGQLRGLVDALAHYEKSRLPFAVRANLRTFTPALAALDRHRAVAVFEGAGTRVTVFPREAQLAADGARRALGNSAYDAAVERGRRMSTQEVAAFIRSELDTLGI